MEKKNNIINIKLKNIITKSNIFLSGFIVIKDKNKKIERKKIKLRINDNYYNIKFPFKRIKNIKILDILSNFYIVKIPIRSIITEKIHNKPFFTHEEDKFSLRYSILGKKGKYLNSKVKIIKDINTSVYIRQSVKNRLIITVREINKTDYLKEQIKINIACFASKLIPHKKILMYEKHAEKYEESASIVYENLIDKGNKNVYYLIDKNHIALEKIEKKYKQNFIFKYTFKHYLTFFSAKAFIGTESPGHAIELRIANKHAAYRIYKGNFNYVFLQHGVMYMVSLESKGRSFFRKDEGMPKNSKVVVSSDLEAKHFIEFAGFTKNDLYITGLPKYDKSKLTPKADKIVIMLTWRPWEYNLIRNNIKDAAYYKLIEKIIKHIPKNLKEKIILMPHPLMLEGLKNSELSKYIPNNFVYNEILENTKILITDYSSIAYDAFYRGSNVIFYWEEKDYCMEQYGGHLMLNKRNIFGPICYNVSELEKTVDEQYYINQEKEYINRYRKIVQFNDNKNTERVIEYLEKDDII